MEMKTCRKCGTTKPIEQYYKSPGYRGGRHTWCIECVKKFYKERYKEHREEISARTKAYAKAHREASRERVRQHRLDHPEQIKAQNRVNWAVWRGTLPSCKSLLCKICGAAATEYHHWSYLPEHALDVIPLCGSCHKRVHLGDIVHPEVPVPQ